MKNFWKEIRQENRPILCLAPMADVTDSSFRHIIAKYSKGDIAPGSSQQYVTYTEFVSADGLILAPEAGRNKLLKDLEYSDIERPIVAQFFTSNPENMRKVAALALELGFDGVDINMGCPDKSIEKQGAGAALIKNPNLARELIRAAKLGVENKIPVSVKTRLGYNTDELEGWLSEILKEKPEALIVHLRTRKEMSKVPAHWDRMKRVVELRNEISSETLVIGNGDIVDVQDALKKCEETGADGAMLGRAMFGSPWLFSSADEPLNKEKIKILKEHIELFDKNLGEVKSFAVMKKHFKAYLHFDHILKNKMMETQSSKEAVEVLNSL